jgi:hypothetical protein
MMVLFTIHKAQLAFIEACEYFKPCKGEELQKWLNIGPLPITWQISLNTIVPFPNYVKTTK